MATVLTDNQHYSDIADAIRAKGVSGTFRPSEMATAIASIPSGDASLNLAYGLTPPEDTSKIWVKTSVIPSKVIISNEIVNIQQAGSIPAGLYGSGVCAIGDDIYVIGGYGPSSNTNTIYKYDTTTETAAYFAQLPRTLYYPACCALGDYIYIFGGSNTKQIYRLDTSDKTITTMTAVLPVGAQIFEAAQINGKCYIFLNKKVYKYDPSNDTLTELAASHPHNNAMKIGCVGNKVYIFGYPNSTKVNIYVFDADTETCTDTGLAPPYNAGAANTAAAIGNKCYIFANGGTYVFDSATGETYTSRVYYYDIWYSNCVEVRGKIYIFGGESMGTPGTTPINGVYRFTASSVDDGNLLIVPDGSIRRSGRVQTIIGTNSFAINSRIADSYIGTEDGTNRHVEIYQYIDSEWTKID